METAETNVVIDPINFQVVEIDGLPSIDGQIYLQRKTDGSIVAAPLTDEIKNMFMPSKSDSTISHSTKTWSRRDILALIENVKNHQKEFQSSTVKNDTIWKRISDKMYQEGMCFTPTQCKDKYKYLKGKYTKKKDNLSDRATGSEPIKFEYFDEMDSFLGNHHNVAPIALASNLKNHDVPDVDKDNDDVLDTEDEAGPSRKKVKLAPKRTLSVHPLAKLTSELRQNADKREENIERRHKENLQSRQQALEIYSQKMDDLIKVLASNRK